MLAYAAQGLPDDQGSHSGGQIREFLGRLAEGLTGLPESFAAAVKQAGFEPAGKYHAFMGFGSRRRRLDRRRGVGSGAALH